MAQISGNTYPVRDALKSMGGRWNAASKCWEVPDSCAEVARKLVERATAGQSGTPAGTPGKCSKCGAACKPPYTLCWDCKPAPRQCTVCGVKADRYTRIYKSGECRDCYEERKMGY